MTILAEPPPYVVEIANASRARVGQIDRLVSLTFSPRFNDVGSYEMVLPAEDPKAALWERSGGIIIYSPLSTTPIFSGQLLGRTLELTTDNEGGEELAWRWYGPSDEVVLDERLTYQAPQFAAQSSPPGVGNQGFQQFDSQGPAVGETVIRHYVDVNAGPGAITARETAGLVLESALSRGATIQASARLSDQTLLKFLQPLASSAGLGFRVRRVGTTLEFGVYVPTDRSASIVFGRERGNLIGFTWIEEAPKITAAIAGGAGVKVAQEYRETVDSATQTTWGRRAEGYVDAGETGVDAEIDQRATEAIVENGAVTSLDITTIDVPYVRYGVDYFLGDLVSVVPGGGVATVVDVLREVTITWDADAGEDRKTTVGSYSRKGTLRMQRRLDLLNAQVAKLQATKGAT